MLADEIGRSQNEHLAHQVGMLLVSADEPDHPPARRTLAHRLKALTHHLLELRPLLNHRRTPPALQQHLLHAREPTA